MNLVEEVVDNMSIEPEIKEVLNDHKRILDKHETDINDLKIEAKLSKERYNNIEKQLTRIENSSLATNATNNALLTSINKLVESNTVKDTNDTQVTAIKNNNRKDIILKALGIISGLVVAYLAGRGIQLTF